MRAQNFPLPAEKGRRMKETGWNSSPAEVDGNFATGHAIQESPLQTREEFCNCIVMYAGENDNKMGRIWYLAR